jgi:hypothetical protein
VKEAFKFGVAHFGNVFVFPLTIVGEDAHEVAGFHGAMMPRARSRSNQNRACKVK